MTRNLEWIKSAAFPASLQAEAYCLESESRTVGISEGKPDLCNASHSVDYCLRIIRDNRAGTLTTTQLSSENLNSLIDKASDIAAVSSVDEHRVFYKPNEKASAPIPVDQTIFSQPNQSVVKELLDIEQQILKHDSRIKKVLKLQKHEVRQQKEIANSLGLNAMSQTTATSVMGEILVEQGNQIEAGWDVCDGRFGKDLHLREWAEQLAQESVQLLGAKPLASGRYSVLFHPRVGTSLLSLLGQALSAEAVQLGKSFLRGSLDQEVVSSLVTLVDDPFLNTGVSSDTMDDEGVPHRKMTMVDQGVLKDYFYDLHSASREEKTSNGHGLKSGVGASPSPMPTNLSLLPGKQSMAMLLQKEKEVFLVQHVMGLHMADPITGEFSLGASGLLYRHGKLEHAVRGVTISGTVLDVFKKITDIGSDLQWKGSYGAPYFLVPMITVAGI